jgi:SpoIID/LytB domain protein
MRTGVTALLAGLALALAAAALCVRADEMSGDDKLRLLYSHRFTFSRSGVPLVTVELMHGERQVVLRSEQPLRILPDGDGGAEVVAGSVWTVTAEKATPARTRFWTVVSQKAADADEAAWKARGYATHIFETGTVFGVEGDVIDSRARLLGVAPEASEAAAAKAAVAIAEKWHVETQVQPELVTRPGGTLVAREAGGAVVRNEGVLWFAPDGEGGTLTVENVAHGGGGARAGEARETRAFRGRIYVTFSGDGSLAVVNALPEDQLLAGIVPSEIFPDAPAEALKAQAVAARDELLAKVGTRHFLDPFLLCSTQHCQVYGGTRSEDARTTRAVEATRGQVLLREGGGLVEAYYSASCGGFGESNENVWGTPPDPSLRGRLDALGADAQALRSFAGGITDENIGAFLAAGERTFCGKGKHAAGRSRWNVHLAGSELDRLVAAEYPAVGHVRELRALRRGVSGRIVELAVTGARGSATVSGELHLRRLLGGLKSSLFVARVDGDGWTLDGAGFGHGVGLCQTGAIGMAEAGYTYGQILEHYFPGSRLRKLY